MIADPNPPSSLPQAAPVEEGDVWGPEPLRRRRAKTPSLATLALGQHPRCATPGTSIWEPAGKRPTSTLSEKLKNNARDLDKSTLINDLTREWDEMAKGNYRSPHPSIYPRLQLDPEFQAQFGLPQRLARWKFEEREPQQLHEAGLGLESEGLINNPPQLPMTPTLTGPKLKGKMARSKSAASWFRSGREEDMGERGGPLRGEASSTFSLTALGMEGEAAREGEETTSSRPDSVDTSGGGPSGSAGNSRPNSRAGSSYGPRGGASRSGSRPGTANASQVLPDEELEVECGLRPGVNGGGWAGGIRESPSHEKPTLTVGGVDTPIVRVHKAWVIRHVPLNERQHGSIQWRPASRATPTRIVAPSRARHRPTTPAGWMGL